MLGTDLVVSADDIDDVGLPRTSGEKAVLLDIDMAEDEGAGGWVFHAASDEEVLKADGVSSGIAHDEGGGKVVVWCLLGVARSVDAAVHAHDQLHLVAENDRFVEFESGDGFQENVFRAGVDRCLEAFTGFPCVNPFGTLGRTNRWNFLDGKIQRNRRATSGIECETLS